MDVDAGITKLLLAGEARTAAEAEEMFLNEHLHDVLRLVDSPLAEGEFRDHPLILLLLAHGSRPSEDSLR